MSKRMIHNPLRRRVVKELLGEWRTYLVISLFLILTIGFISGMYVANGSMMKSNEDGKSKYHLEYGHFELKKKANKTTLQAISTGTKADVHQYMLDKAKDKLDEKFEPEFKKKFDPKFKTEFDKKFNQEFKGTFDREFKSQFRKEFDPKFKTQFDKGFQTNVKKAFDGEFSKQVLAQLKAQGLDTKTVKSMLPAAVSTAKKDGTYDKAYQSAYKQAKKSSYRSAYSKAYKSAYGTAYRKAYPTAYRTAYRKAYSSAYGTAYTKAYKEAYDKAYDKAWNKAKKSVNKKYKKLIDKYELNDTDAPAIPVTLYENFYRNASEDYNVDGTSDGTVRVFAKTKYINQASIITGSLPQSKDEIAIDRMHADNVSIKVGDTISVGGSKFKVTGLIAYVNYSTLHEKNTDLMFDALKFNVAMVTEDAFQQIKAPMHYSYAWEYQKTPKDNAAEKTQSDYFMKALLTQTVVADNELKDYLPRYANSAVNFAPDDMGSDMAMGGVLLYILIAIIAFIFAVTISNTIQREASAIGTLRASGYTKGELIRHYITMPMIVTLLAALIGNVLGYTLFKNTVISMYYNSYSLPTYKTLWNADAFLHTTVIPLILMLVINLLVITHKMQLSPLKFLRHDLKRLKQKKAIPLPKIHFFGRFRLRIILQNLPNFAVLFLGIYFVAVMLAMAVGMPSTLKYYQDNASNMMFAKYQYVLTDYEDADGKLVTTKTDGAEKFATKTLIRKGDTKDEEISIYGTKPDSQYVKISNFGSLKNGEVYISDSFAGKFGLAKGDTFTLQEEYENAKYTFTVAGIYEKSMSLSVFMPLDQYRSTFDENAKSFNGFLSNRKVSDVDEDQIATVITEKDITKMADQLDHSMGSYMTYFQYLCVLLSAVLIFLLTKIIIEKNEVSISMIKILGYTNGEIFRLYLLSTTIVVILADALCVLLGALTMQGVWQIMLQDFNGWFAFKMSPMDYGKMFGFILLGYLIVLFFDFRRIKKIPMDQALKNVE